MQKRKLDKALALSLTSVLVGCNVAPILAVGKEDGKSNTVNLEESSVDEESTKTEGVGVKKKDSAKVKEKILKREQDRVAKEKQKEIEEEAKNKKIGERGKEFHYVDINDGVVPTNPKIEVNLLAENENISIVDTELLKAINNSLGRGYVTEPVTEADMLSLVYLITPDDSKLNNIRSLSGLEYAKNLEVLDVKVGYLQEGIDNIKDLNKLTFLNLDNASVNQDGLAIINGLTNLKCLSLKYNYVTDTNILKNLTNLEYLNLDGNYTLTDLSTLSTLTTLTNLSIVSASLSDISFLSGMTNLEHLNLSKNYRIKDINVIGELSNLTHLNISQLDNLNDISPLASLTKLEYLDLNGNFSISNCTSISNLTSLKHLDIGNIGNLRDISFMSSLINLKEIGMSGTPVKDLAPLSTLRGITWLDIRSSSITTLDNIDFAPTMDYLSLANTSLLKSTALNKIEKINGDLDLNNSKLDTLYSLINVTEIGGDLILSNCKMGNLFGFYELLKVGGDIDLSYLGWEYTSSILPGFDQFNKLQSVGGTINFYKSKITELEGFTSLQTVGGSINLKESRLKYLRAFKNLQTVGGDLNLSSDGYYGDLRNIESIKNIEKIGGVLDLGKTNLIELPELSSLKELGGLDISNTNITDISLLSKFTTFKGNINLSATNIVDFSSLSNITSIEGDLYLHHTKIENLDMLSNLTSIHSLYVYGTDISNLDGLRNLKTIKGDLDLLSLPKLENIDGLQGLKRVEGYLSLCTTSMKNIDGLSELTYVGEELDLYGTDLENLDALSNLEYIGDYFDLEDTPTLKNIDGLSKLKYVGDYIDFTGSNITNVDGLKNLEEVGDSLYLYGIPLANVDGLCGLKNIGGDLYINDTNITNIKGLANLEYVNGRLGIYNNFMDIEDEWTKSKLSSIEDEGATLLSYTNQNTLKSVLKTIEVLPSKGVNLLSSIYGIDSSSKTKYFKKDTIKPYVEYLVEDEDVVTVDEQGVVTFLKEGTTNITIQFNNAPHTKVVIPVEAKKDIEDVGIGLGEDKETITLTPNNVNMVKVKNLGITDLTFSNDKWVITDNTMKSEPIGDSNTTTNECKFNAKLGDTLSLKVLVSCERYETCTISLNGIELYRGAGQEEVNILEYLKEGDNTLTFTYKKDSMDSYPIYDDCMYIKNLSVINYGATLPLDKIEYRLIDEKVREGEVEWLEYTTPFKIDRGTTIEARGVSGEIVGDISTYTLSNGAKPVITAEDRVLKVSDAFNILEGVSATDEEDGPIALEEIKYVSDVKEGIAGDYIVTYTVEDKDGNITTKTISVKIETDEVAPPIDEEVPPIEGTEPPIDEVVPPVDDTKPPTDDDKKPTDDDKTPTDDDKTPTDDDKTPTDDDKTPTDDKKPTDDDKKPTDDDKKPTDDDKTPITDEKPVISVEDRVIELGAKIDLLEGVVATDKEDGNLTDKVIIKESNVDIFKEGVYSVTYYVKDSKGNETTKTIRLEVKDTKETVIEKVITIIAEDRTVEKDSTFNVLQGVSVKDNYGVDYTGMIKITKNNVDTTKEGVYDVVYSAIIEEKEYTKTIKVTVVNTKEEQKEEVNTDKEGTNSTTQSTDKEVVKTNDTVFTHISTFILSLISSIAILIKIKRD